MNVIINIELMNSATIETPETIERMVRARMNKMIAGDAALSMFVRDYSIGVKP